MFEYLKTKASGHLLAVAVAVIVVIAGSAWLSDHDAKILAQQTVKQSQDRVAILEKQVQDVDRAGKEQIARLQKKAEAVKTAPQAIAAIPDVSSLPLNPRPVPELPDAVTVQALPLFQELSKCRQTEVGLSTCEAKQAEQEKI